MKSAPQVWLGGWGRAASLVPGVLGGKNRLGYKIISFWLEESSGFEVAEAFWHLCLKQ